MNTKDIADYMRQHYPLEDYILLTLVSCSLLLSNIESDVPEIQLVEDVLRNLREALPEESLLAVSVMMAEIDRLRDEEDN
jgi:flagellin-specific chaperone FliS